MNSTFSIFYFVFVLVCGSLRGGLYSSGLKSVRLGLGAFSIQGDVCLQQVQVKVCGSARMRATFSHRHDPATTNNNQLRPYTRENTGTRPISEVKHELAQSVLWWGTTREYWVLQFCLLLPTFIFFFTSSVQVQLTRTQCHP